MTESSRAVFLSYASEDLEAARHIADTLQTAGIEVWFDQSELRGGDSWDHKIRKQQWMRLPAGEAPAVFVQRVARLLSCDKQVASTPVRLPARVSRCTAWPRRS